jgi:hypothetical protein
MSIVDELAIVKGDYMLEQHQKTEVLPMEKSSVHGVNQQETLTEEEIGWLAGLIDGEGSIIMSNRHKKIGKWEGKGVEVQVTMGNTDGGIVKKYIDLLRKIGINPYVVERMPNQHGHLIRPIVYATISRMEHIKKLLEILEPNLAGEKKHRAKIMIEFVTKRISSKRGWYTKSDFEIVSRFKDPQRTYASPGNGMICSELSGDRKNSPETMAVAA